MILLLLVGVFFFAVLWFIRESYQAKNRPPGPMQFPIVGSMLQVAVQHPVGFIALDKLSKKYGDVMSIKLGQANYAFVSSYETIKHFYGGEDCLNRACAGMWLERNFNKNLGILFSNDKVWAETRKFCNQAFQINSFLDKEWLRNTLQDEVHHLMQHLDEETKSSPDHVVAFTVTGAVKCSFVNLICASLSGERHEYSDRQLQELTIALEKFFRASTLGVSVMMAYPFLRFVFGKALGYHTQMESVRGVHKYSSELIDKSRQLGSYKQGKAHNFIEAFLQKMEETKDDPNTLYTEEQFLVLITDFFTAGSETTANWFLFAILLLMTHPDKQEKLFKEIKTVVGDRLPKVEDRDKMIYTQAVMNEVHRWAKITISLSPREATRDIEYNGRIIKKGTTIMANMYPVFHDKEFWGDPEVFRPERFIDANGKLTKTERMVQFGLGKRVCFGDGGLAKDSAFIYLTTMIQRYKILLPDEYATKKPSLRLVEGITTCTENFRAKLVKRVG